MGLAIALILSKAVTLAYQWYQSKQVSHIIMFSLVVTLGHAAHCHSVLLSLTVNMYPYTVKAFSLNNTALPT